MSEHEELAERVTNRRDELCDELETLSVRRVEDKARIAGIRAELEYLAQYKDITPIADGHFMPNFEDLVKDD